MKRDLKYFMREQSEEIVHAPAPASFKDDEGNPIDLEIRVLSNAQIQRINDGYRRRSIALDKSGNPYISNGEVVFKTERDSGRAMRHIIAEALVYPNLKDKELMDFYKCYDITEMPLLVFSKMDEYTAVSRAVMAALGMVDDGESGDNDIEEAKN